MIKWPKYLLILSILLNVLLIVGFAIYRKYGTSTINNIAEYHSDYIIEHGKYILGVIDSNDPNRISHLKTSTKMQIEIYEKDREKRKIFK